MSVMLPMHRPMYELYLQHLRDEVLASSGFAVCFDGWSSTMTPVTGSSDSFIGISIAYTSKRARTFPSGDPKVPPVIKDCYGVDFAPVATQHLLRPHSAARITALIQAVFRDRLGLDLTGPGLVALITDNAATEVRAANDIKEAHVPCLCHTIHLAVTDALGLASVRAPLRLRTCVTAVLSCRYEQSSSRLMSLSATYAPTANCVNY